MPARVFENLVRQSRNLNRGTQARLWRFVFCPSSEDKIVIETQGVDFVAWTKQVERGTTIFHKSAIQPLTVTSLNQTMSAFEYFGRPVSIVLHPPCVCLKSFQIGTTDASKWLATHLSEIAPPGNRREQVVSFQTDKLGSLLIAFTRKAFLTEISELLYECRVSVKEVIVGGVVVADSTISVNENEEKRADFALCSYTASRNDNGIQIIPSLSLRCSTISAPTALQRNALASNSELPAAKPVSLSAADVPAFMTNSHSKHDLDFRTQLGLPGTLPMSGMQRTIRTITLLFVALVILLLLSWGAQLIVGRRGSSPEHQSVVSELAHTRQANERLADEIDQILSSRSPRFTASTFLKAVALATPPQTWLTSITYNNTSTNPNCAFSIIGYSLGGEEPLQFIDSLRSNRAILTVNLSKGNLVENRSRPQVSQGMTESLTKFEITGQYANK